MPGSPRRLTIRKQQLLAAVQDNPGLVAQQLSRISGLDPSFVRKALDELRARSLVLSVTNQENSKRCWYSAC
jgi:DNA-binding MarR family transcriptional regulator